MPRMPLKIEPWLVWAHTFLHLCPKLQHVGEGAASPSHFSLHLYSPSPALLQCGLFSGGHKGMCSQSGPLGAPIIQVMKGSSCTRNTRASWVSKPKPNQTFHYQHFKLGKMDLTVLFLPILQLSHSWHASFGSQRCYWTPQWEVKQDSSKVPLWVIMMVCSWAAPYPQGRDIWCKHENITT